MEQIYSYRDSIKSSEIRGSVAFGGTVSRSARRLVFAAKYIDNIFE